MRLLAPFDLSLLEAVRIAVGIKTKEHASVLVSESLDSWLAACGGLRAKTLSNYGGTCARLRTEFGDRVWLPVSPPVSYRPSMPSGSDGGEHTRPAPSRTGVVGILRQARVVRSGGVQID
jgi:hypothetical protein